MAEEDALVLLRTLAQAGQGLTQPGDFGHDIGGAAIQSANSRLAQIAVENAEKEREEAEEAGLFGDLGGLAGSLAGAAIPGVGPVVGPLIGGVAGQAAGTAAGGGDPLQAGLGQLLAQGGGLLVPNEAIEEVPEDQAGKRTVSSDINETRSATVRPSPPATPVRRPDEAIELPAITAPEGGSLLEQEQPLGFESASSIQPAAQAPVPVDETVGSESGPIQRMRDFIAGNDFAQQSIQNVGNSLIQASRPSAGPIDVGLLPFEMGQQLRAQQFAQDQAALRQQQLDRDFGFRQQQADIANALATRRADQSDQRVATQQQQFDTTQAGVQGRHEDRLALSQAQFDALQKQRAQGRVTPFTDPESGASSLVEIPRTIEPGQDVVTSKPFTGERQKTFAQRKDEAATQALPEDATLEDVAAVERQMMEFEAQAKEAVGLQFYNGAIVNGLNKIAQEQGLDKAQEVLNERVALSRQAQAMGTDPPTLREQFQLQQTARKVLMDYFTDVTGHLRPNIAGVVNQTAARQANQAIEAAEGHFKKVLQDLAQRGRPAAEAAFSPIIKPDPETGANWLYLEYPNLLGEPRSAPITPMLIVDPNAF